jgi:hypothetical protein
MRYCPKCFDTSINLEPRGVVHFIINGTHQETNQLLFNLAKEQDIFIQEFREKIQKFMTWYSQFKNHKPVSTIQIFTNNYRCTNGCTFSANLRFSVVDILIPASTVVEIIKEEGIKHGIKTTLESEDIIV